MKNEQRRIGGWCTLPYANENMKRIYNYSFLILISLLISCAPEFWQGFANGLNAYNGGQSTQKTLCVKYMTSAGWSEGYSVEATILTGSELNTRTKTYNYNSYSTYVVVFWGPGQASILELDYYGGSISAFGQLATDQQGRQWQVANTSYCY
jgi:hypothetical protein